MYVLILMMFICFGWWSVSGMIIFIKMNSLGKRLALLFCFSGIVDVRSDKALLVQLCLGRHGDWVIVLASTTDLSGISHALWDILEWIDSATDCRGVSKQEGLVL